MAKYGNMSNSGGTSYDDSAKSNKGGKSYDESSGRPNMGGTRGVGGSPGKPNSTYAGTMNKNSGKGK